MAATRWSCRDARQLIQTNQTVIPAKAGTHSAWLARWLVVVRYLRSYPRWKLDRQIGSAFARVTVFCELLPRLALKHHRVQILHNPPHMRLRIADTPSIVIPTPAGTHSGRLARRLVVPLTSHSSQCWKLGPGIGSRLHGSDCLLGVVTSARLQTPQSPDPPQSVGTRWTQQNSRPSSESRAFTLAGLRA